MIYLDKIKMIIIWINYLMKRISGINGKKKILEMKITPNLQKDIFGKEEYISKIFLFNFIINEKFLIIK